MKQRKSSIFSELSFFLTIALIAIMFPIYYAHYEHIQREGSSLFPPKFIPSIHAFDNPRDGLEDCQPWED